MADDDEIIEMVRNGQKQNSREHCSKLIQKINQIIEQDGTVNGWELIYLFPLINYIDDNGEYDGDIKPTFLNILENQKFRDMLLKARNIIKSDVGDEDQSRFLKFEDLIDTYAKIFKVFNDYDLNTVIMI
ncbi:Hypothetical protein HVR_LOCUS124 [uncultured virus]|nr:Hypothetical protein HVR_LOCUS124 [uncultured virus]